jgi:thioredoxin 1
MTEPPFFERLQKPRPVVVDFWAPWCGPCHMIDPILKKVGQEYDGRVDVWKINADEQPDLLRQLHIYGIPTLIGFNAGQEVARQTGVASPQVISALFESALSGEKSAFPRRLPAPARLASPPAADHPGPGASSLWPITAVSRVSTPALPLRPGVLLRSRSLPNLAGHCP